MEPALLDLDFHGGDGSFDCSTALRLWFKSLHYTGAYPWVDMADAGIEVSPGTGWGDGYSAALHAALAELPTSTTVLVVSLGYDTLATDPEVRKRSIEFALNPEDFRAVGAALAGACRKVIIVQEGGYDLPNLPRAAKALVTGLSTHVQSSVD